MEGERDNLIPIGRFAFLTGLSRRALRFYDERGLLQPAFVDEWTGYRYYSPGQLRVANRIRSLRELDLPLDEVERVIAGWGSLGEVLSGHESRLRERVAASERALALLQQLSEEEEKMDLAIEVREVPALRTACVEVNTSVDRVGADVGPAYQRLFEELGAAGIAPAGPGLIGYPEEDFDPEAFRALVAYPIEGDLPAGSVAKMVDFPGGRAAVATVVGPYERLQQAWQQVHAWIAGQGLRVSAMPYEVYRIDHCAAPSPEEIETDIVVPVS
jgi:DNA-binding transcriptional MerR regulator